MQVPPIPQIDLSYPLYDTGYGFSFTEGDGSKTLGRMGLEFPFQFSSGLGGYSQVASEFMVATNNGYNSAGGAMTPTPVNYVADPTAKTGYTPTGTVTGNRLQAFRDDKFLDMTWDTGNPSSASVVSTLAGDYTIGAASNQIKIAIDGGAAQTVIFGVGQNTNDEIANQINSIFFPDVVAYVSGEYVVLQSPTTGAASEVDILAVADDAYTVLGFTVGSTFGEAAPASGTVFLRLSDWPSALDYSAPTIKLDIANVQHFSFGGLYPVYFSDGSQGFVCWGVSLVDFSNYLLPITLGFTPTAWVLDPSSVPSSPTVSYPSNPDTANYQADLSAAPDITIWEHTFNITVPTAMVVTSVAANTGTLSTDAVNAFLPADILYGAGSASFTYSPIGVFGLDWASGNNTGAWYCAFDCSAFGQVTFPMDDSSIGPSTDPSVYWVNDLKNNAGPIADEFWYYPQWTNDPSLVFWIRVPLQVAGVMTFEALTGEMYVNVAPPPPAPNGPCIIDPTGLPYLPLPFCFRKACIIS